ncbi:tetratricopeptide repeat protein [Thioclava sp. A2]|uniref:tetratricopeptide repeat protein n=1 Tax=Thioclava sp. FCG-A2 TaxID=3080562 RepID=UPI002954985C|nr:tetratricopeptide repeat protein [Thioclava sp. A2]MDV7270500.1 tetratricopeptide repeat protein [Thioclava sp. A2]
MTNLAPKLRSALVAILLGTAWVPPAMAEDAGAYLAARVASGVDDYVEASRYYQRLIAGGDADAGLIEAGLISEIGRANFDAALPLAQRLSGIEGNDQIAALLLLAKPVREGDFLTAQSYLVERGEQWPMGPDLVMGWLEAGLGHMSDAMESFDKAGAQPGLEAFAAYHKALALAMVGDFEGANEQFEGDNAFALESLRRGAVAHAQILSQLERNADAIAVLDRVFGQGSDAEIIGLRADLEAGKTLPFTVLKDAREGVAEVYFSIGSALVGEVSNGFGLMFTRIATWLRPDHSDAVLISASILESLEQYDLAIATYTQIAPDGPTFPAAEIGRAEALVHADKAEAAIEVLESLSRSHGDQAGVWVSLGDTLRREERFKEAAAAYDKAIDLLGDPQPKDWFVWYARAIAQERSDNWKKAEAGFRKALELSPGQPSVLNYLGYSYLEKHQNLDEALKMIEQAVAARPDSGYIVDSLGWALYRMGRYEEAAVQMERAVELEAIDPVVNDHLGDVYWAVGRKREAEFQWRRALSFPSTEELDLERVRRKLEVGLDVVLAEEGADPLGAQK